MTFRRLCEEVEKEEEEEGWSLERILLEFNYYSRSESDEAFEEPLWKKLRLL